ncbi:MAG: septum formation protein Maf [Clostridia bacterium]|nr:septum formation protein Maf [Clostridia bacterium]
MSDTVFKNIEVLCLASASPRRKELASRLGLPLTVISVPADESYTAAEPARAASEIAYKKALAVLEKRGYQPGEVILTADTSVWLDGTDGGDPVMLGKPSDADNAREMLRSLSGRAHRVFTGVTLVYRSGSSGKLRIVNSSVATKVFVAELTDAEIEAYIRTGDPLDKAGAYGIQGPFGKHITRIEGDYTNVVGLPLPDVYRLLKEADEDFSNDWYMRG